jgi:hypothetical protein
MPCHVMQVCPLECTPYAGRNKVNMAVLSFVYLFFMSPLTLICSTALQPDFILSITASPCHAKIWKVT